jgi:putative ABC transport system ATP-binding protein
VEADQPIVALAVTVASGPPPLVVRDLYRFYRAGDEETLALRGISLTVEAGELVVVAGPSGSGKSTLVSLVAGLDEPDGGDVRLAGERMSHRPEGQRTLLRRHRLGVVRQSGNLLGHLDVQGNVALVRRLGSRPETGRRSVAELLEDVGLVSRARALPAELSGGELARAAVAVALARNPAVLLADEPTGELDLANERRVLGLLRAAAASGAAVLVASHSAVIAAGADRVLHLADGRWADGREGAA